MTTTHSHEYTDLTTSMHIAAPTPRVHVPPAYGVRFGVAAVVLSLFGVPDSKWSQPVSERPAASQPVGHSEPVRAAHATEWDSWKPARDLG